MTAATATKQRTFLTPDQFADRLRYADGTRVLHPDQVRRLCAWHLSNPGDAEAIRCANIAPPGALRARYLIDEAEVDDWFRRLSTSVKAGGVL